MGMKVNEASLKKYGEQLTGIPSESHETMEQYLNRVYSVLEGAKFPFSSFYIIDERCSFLEAVMLGRKKSLLWTLLDQMEDTVLVGLEQSTAYVGKNSLFCAFRCCEPRHFSDKMDDLAPALGTKGHVVCANVQPNNEVYAAASFSAFIHDPF